MKLLFFFFPILISNEICKFSMTCENKIDETCLLKKKTEADNIYNIIIYPLKHNKEKYCNIYDSLFNLYEEDIKEEQYIQFLPKFPGGKCTRDLECLFGFCKDFTCINSINNIDCTINENCPLNQTCINYKCSQLRKLNEKCNFSTDCEFNLYCNKKNKTCKKTFSFKDGSDITDEFIENEQPELLCESGGYYINNENKYICATLINVNNLCYDDCEYIIKHTNEIIHIPENCLCGFNKYRSKHCVLGNGDNKFKEYLKLKKKFISNTNYTSLCHTTERFSNDICVELQTKRSVLYREEFQNYNNHKILALEHHRLQNSDECIKEEVFNYNTLPVIPDSMSCPKIKCNEKINNCSYGFNPFNENGDNITLLFNEKKCNKNEKCIINSNNERFFINYIFSNKNISGSCIKKMGDSNSYSRYLGEECDEKKNQCINNSECKNKKCVRFIKDNKCKKNEDCIVGLFCNVTSEKCEKQKNEGEFCKDSWECKNYLGCYKNSCIKYGSLKANMRNTEEESLFSGDEEKRFYLCEYGKLDQTNTFCTITDYDSYWIFQNNKTVKDGFVECENGELCHYVEGKGNFTLNCECGFNEEGKGYCPIPININKHEWKRRMNLLSELTNNKCHTLNRFKCYSYDNNNIYEQYNLINAKTTNAHLLYNSPKCIQNMYGTGFLLKVNLVFILFLGLII